MVYYLNTWFIDNSGFDIISTLSLLLGTHYCNKLFYCLLYGHSSQRKNPWYLLKVLHRFCWNLHTNECKIIVKVTFSIYKCDSKTYLIIISDAISVWCTTGHRVYIESGWHEDEECSHWYLLLYCWVQSVHGARIHP